MSEKMTTANSAEQGKVDIDFAECAVPKWSRRRFVTMFMIMLGFTFFSASMWVGQEMAAGLDFWGFIKALLLGGAILGIYTDRMVWRRYCNVCNSGSKTDRSGKSLAALFARCDCRHLHDRFRIFRN